MPVLFQFWHIITCWVYFYILRTLVYAVDSIKEQSKKQQICFIFILYYSLNPESWRINCFAHVRYKKKNSHNMSDRKWYLKKCNTKFVYNDLD